MKCLLAILYVFIASNGLTQYCRAVHTIKDTGTANNRSTVITKVNSNTFFVTVCASTTDTLRFTVANIDSIGETSNYIHSVLNSIPGTTYSLSGVATIGDDIIIALLAEGTSLTTLSYLRYNTISQSITEENTLPTSYYRGYVRSRQKGDSLVTYIAHSGGTSRISTNINGVLNTNSADYTATIMYNSSNMSSGRRRSELLITPSGIEYIALNATIVKRSLNGVYTEVALTGSVGFYGSTMNLNSQGDLLVISGSYYHMFNSSLSIINQGFLNSINGTPKWFSELFFENGAWSMYYKNNSNKSIKLVMDNGMVTISEFVLNGGPFSPYDQFSDQNETLIVGYQEHEIARESIAIIKDKHLQLPGIFYEYSQEFDHHSLRFNTGHLNATFNIERDLQKAGVRLLHEGIYKPIFFWGQNSILGENSSGDTIGVMSPSLSEFMYPGPYTPKQNRSFESMDKYNRSLYVDKAMIDNHIIQITNGNSGYNMPLGIMNWPAHGDVSIGQAQNIAPFYDHNSNGFYEPELGDYPSIYGNRCILNVYHQGEEAGINGEIELECLQYIYVYDCNSSQPLMNTIFVNHTFKIYNNTINNTYIGTHVDIDLGGYNDDYAGTFVDIGMMYQYNSDNYDEDSPTAVGFHSYPAAAGVQFLKGAQLDPDGLDNAVGVAINESVNGYGFNDGIIDNEYLGLVGSSADYQPAANYSKPEWYNSSQGMDQYGVYPQVNGVDVRHAYFGNSDPQHYSAWGLNHGNNHSEFTLGNSLGDRNVIGSTGPINLDANNINSTEIVTAYIVSIDSLTPQTNIMESVTDLYKFGIEIRDMYSYDSLLLCGSLFDFYVSPITLSLEKESIEANIYPNPTYDELFVSVSSGLIHNITIMDASGRLVHSSKPELNFIQLNISNLKEGFYFVQIETENGMLSKRIIKL